jgi:uncharacterized protein (DUF1330 family)
MNCLKIQSKKKDRIVSAYIIVGITPKDIEKLQQYSANVAATLAKFSGEVLIKGKVEQLHGEFEHQVQLILEFPTRDDAYNWYHSDEYQALLPVRDQGMSSQFQLIS